MTRTHFHKIDKNPSCIQCKKEAEYTFERRGFFSSFDCSLCFDCLIENLKKYKVFTYRKKLLENKNGSA